MVETNDWRLTKSHENIKKEKEWKFKIYTPRRETWEHEHCVLCGDKISQYENTIHEGYTSTSKGRKDYWWLCPECFNDFKEMFGWEVVEEK